jgi:anti-sigma-K factor RskA
MTDRMTEMSGHGDCGGDAAAYALGALDAAEAEAFRRHLATCAICQDEVVSFEQTAGALALAAPQLRAPRSLRRRIMRAVRAEPDLRLRPARRELVSRRRWGVMGLPRAAWAGGVAVAVALAAGGFGLAELTATGGQATRVISARVVGSTGRAQLRLRGPRGELIVNHFPAPPKGRIYEVWLQRGDGAPSPTSALFSVTASGSAAVDVPGDLHGVRVVMVTPEPLGGSAAPTHAPVIVARL